MADISKDELRKEISAILKGANLSTTSAKKVRQQLEVKLDCSLINRKKEIDDLVMNYVNSKDEDGSEADPSDEEGSDEEEDEDAKKPKKKPVKRPAPASVKKSKKSKTSNSEDESESEEGSGESDDDGEYNVKKPVPKKKAPPKKKGKGGSESDSDSDWGKTEKPKKAPAAGGRGKGGGYTRAYKLSPQLATLMGKESMARHEVVKQMWALIKERNLYDPNNKQFAICDDDLYKVLGVKRFRTFGMMKYLKTHFHE